MVGLAWGVIGAIALYASRVYFKKSEQENTSTQLEAARSTLIQPRLSSEKQR
jgi:hypothetical protein